MDDASTAEAPPVRPLSQASHRSSAARIGLHNQSSMDLGLDAAPSGATASAQEAKADTAGNGRGGEDSPHRRSASQEKKEVDEANTPRAHRRRPPHPGGERRGGGSVRGESKSRGRARMAPSHTEFARDLHRACAKGRVDQVDFLLSEFDDDPNTRDSAGATPLYIAARSGWGEVCGRLMQDTRVLPSKANRRGFTPLFTACLHGYLGVVQALTLGRDLRRMSAAATLSNGFTPLHAAAQNDHVTVVQRLCRSSFVDVNRRTKSGATPFYIACRKGAADCVTYLLGVPAVDVNTPTHHGGTPFFAACLYGHTDVVELLLRDPRVEVHSNTLDGCNGMWGAAVRDHRATVELLLRDGRVDPDHSDRVRVVCGVCCVLCAVRRVVCAVVCVVVCAVLVACMRTTGHTNERQRWPSTHTEGACTVCTCVVSRLCLGRCGFVWSVRQDGCSPLMVAVENGFYEVARALLTDTRVNAWKANNVRSTPFIAAACNGDMDLVELLLTTHQPQLPLPPLDLLNAVDADGHSAFFMASCNGSVSVVRYLLQVPGVEVQTWDATGYSPFIIAAANGHLATVEVLARTDRIQVGQPRVKGGPTALYVACEANHVEVVEFLLSDARVDVHANDAQVCSCVMCGTGTWCVMGAWMCVCVCGNGCGDDTTSPILCGRICFHPVFVSRAAHHSTPRVETATWVSSRFCSRTGALTRTLPPSRVQPPSFLPPATGTSAPCACWCHFPPSTSRLRYPTAFVHFRWLLRMAMTGCVDFWLWSCWTDLGVIHKVPCGVRCFVIFCFCFGCVHLCWL